MSLRTTPKMRVRTMTAEEVEEVEGDGVKVR
jgi:hypothetical protein